MKVTELSASIAELVLSSEQSATRSPGVHISTIIRYMKEQLERQGSWPSDELENSSQIGRVWETYLARALGEAAQDQYRYVRPGELEMDGIVGSPDGLDCEDPAIIEFKATWVSSSRPIAERRRDYLWQIKSYCHMAGIPVARLYVLYVNGNYKPPMPQVKGYQYEFSTGELRENWNMILRNKEDMEDIYRATSPTK